MLTTLYESLSAITLTQVLEVVLIVLPRILAAFVVLVLGVLVGQGCSTVVARFLKKMKISEKIENTFFGRLFKNENEKKNYEDILGGFIYALVMIVATQAAVGIIGVEFFISLLTAVIVDLPELILELINSLFNL